MQIPATFHGSWRGEITDENRVNPYAGEIVVEAGRVTAHYEMKRRDVNSTFHLVSASEDLIFLQEEASNSFKGTLRLTLTSKGHLKCVWHFNGSKKAASAEMTRFA